MPEIDRAKLLAYMYASRNTYMEEARTAKAGKCQQAAFGHDVRATTFDLMIHVIKVGLVDVYPEVTK